jgi:hypothetical protein
LTGFVAVVLIFSIPITAIITNHFQKLAKFKQGRLKEELQLESLKHENFLLETEKLRLELQIMQKKNDDSTHSPII